MVTQKREIGRRAIEIEDVIEPARRRYLYMFSERWPALVCEWYSPKNCGWGPGDFGYGSTVRAWFKCPDCQQIYKAALCDRSKGSGCPYCASRKVCDANSLAKLCPTIAAQWHPKRNGKKKPSEFMRAAKEVVWWKCEKGSDHEWNAPIFSRTRSKAESAGCPFCQNMRLSKTNSLASVFPDLALQWHPAKNKSLKPDQIVAHSHKKVWWLCDKGHSWKQAPGTRARGINCPYCGGHFLTKEASLAFRFPEIAREWHPELNETKPIDVPPGTKKKYWWRCSIDPLHKWQAGPGQRTGDKTGCPHCTFRKVPKERSLASLSPLVAAQWHRKRNGNLSAEMLGSGGNVTRPPTTCDVHRPWREKRPTAPAHNANGKRNQSLRYTSWTMESTDSQLTK